ncbi:uncharacterized protein B0H18DRAFT_1041167, partial [Fomitopsis serialis]|uniref:uncharacterized protein n=1 Tax=Fomitopsis serialis TaxID=139415 RepID=UPI0020086537
PDYQQPAPADHHDPSIFSSNVHFQLPALILGAPTRVQSAFPKYQQHVYPQPSAPPAHYQPSPLIPTSPDPSLHSSYAPARLVQTPVSATRSPYPDPPPHPVVFPTSLGLPVYSTSGFDFLALLTALTGYSEQEVLGRNCRFLQAPGGRVLRGEPRRYTAPEAVHALKDACASHKECQTSIINYRKDGQAFINLVTIIPVPAADHEEVAYYVGFQVDLAEQPSAILQKLRDGSYMVDYSRSAPFSAPSAPVQRNWRTASAAMSGVSSELHDALSDATFLQSFASALPGSAGSGVVPGSATSAAATTSSPANEQSADPYDSNKPLNLLLLAATPDFVHVVSLKGVFLYVAPSVRDVLGYEPAELVGRSLAEFCHRADVVPLTRELKDSSVTPGSGAPAPARTESRRKVDLLFRIRTKRGELVWLECRGRLHAEPGKARKAIILSGRVRSMPQLEWGPVARGGGLAPATTVVKCDPEDGEETRVEEQHEFWGLVSAGGTWLFAGHAVADVLGWGATEVIGRMVQRALSEALAVVVATPSAGGEQESRAVNCDMKRKDGSRILVRAAREAPVWAGPRPVVCQVRRLDVNSIPGARPRLMHSVTESVFAELGARRESSWQYELQQLKFANERLREEVEVLEAAVEGAVQQHQKRHRHEHQQAHVASEWRPSYAYDALGHQRIPSAPVSSNQRPMRLPMKRPWDADDGPT